MFGLSDEIVAPLGVRGGWWRDRDCRTLCFIQVQSCQGMEVKYRIVKVSRSFGQMTDPSSFKISRFKLCVSVCACMCVCICVRALVCMCVCAVGNPIGLRDHEIRRSGSYLSCESKSSPIAAYYSVSQKRLLETLLTAAYSD